MATALCDGFTYEGYEVVLAKDGEAGLKAAREAASVRGEQHSDHHADRARSGDRQGLGTKARRRRLCHEALRVHGADGSRRGVAPAYGGGARHAEVYGFGDVVVDFKKAELKKNGSPVEVTARELKLLEFFIAHRRHARRQASQEDRGQTRRPSIYRDRPPHGVQVQRLVLG